MSSRFIRNSNRRVRHHASGSNGDGLGEWWAAIAVIVIAAMAIFSLTGSSEPTAHVPERIDSSARILDSLKPASNSLGAIELAFKTLCKEPVLVAIEFEPDCESGVMTLGAELFDGYGSAELLPIAKEDVAAAVSTYLARLRKSPAIWESLEAIEIRGHSDPRAVRDPYTTNLVGSQQRALGVLLFLLGPANLAAKDRVDLERLAIVSGASFSRPPAVCPEHSRECYPAWRRVEIRPVLSEMLRRGDWSRTVEAVRSAVRPL